MLPHAPGVQMADIPADGVAIKEDVDDADPDKRNPQQVSDDVISRVSKVNLTSQIIGTSHS